MKENPNSKFVVDGKLVLQLYVSGMSGKSMEAIENIKHLCDEHLMGIIELEVIDIYKNPEAAVENQIIFSPSLIKQLPLPKRTLIGTFSDTEKVIKGLGIQLTLVERSHASKGEPGFRLYGNCPMVPPVAVLVLGSAWPVGASTR